MKPHQSSLPMLRSDQSLRCALSSDRFTFNFVPAANRDLRFPGRPTGLLILCLIVGLFGACRSANRSGGAANDNANDKRLSAIAEVDFIDQIEIFATDIGELGDAAWKELQAYPRQELIDRLERMRDSANQDEIDKANAAFVLCNLDHEYAANKQIIVSVFNGSPDGADQCELLLGRLVGRGDSQLLQVLFAAVPDSDGDLTEGLAYTFAEELKHKPEAFLTQLRSQPRTIRRKVSEYVGESTSDEDRMEIVESLKAIPTNSPLADLAREIRLDLSEQAIDLVR